jgi:thiosulfate dehydrogenase (quinone) large subunit
MATIHFHAQERATAGEAVTRVPAIEEVSTIPTPARRALALLRVAFGLTFLWAFVDKLFGLGYATASKDSWLNGGSPTFGFLKFGAAGPFKGFYNSIAGQTWADWLFMLALLGLGLALTFGVGMRIAMVAGTVLYLMMWSVALPPANNPVLDDHILGAVSMVVLGLTLAGDTWGLGRMWGRLPFVREHRILR